MLHHDLHDPHDPGSVLNNDQALLQGREIDSAKLWEDVLSVRVGFEHPDEGLSTSLEQEIKISFKFWLNSFRPRKP